MWRAYCSNMVHFIEYFSFPEVHDLAEADDLEEKLRVLKFGYRAKFISGENRRVRFRI